MGHRGHRFSTRSPEHMVRKHEKQEQYAPVSLTRGGEGELAAISVKFTHNGLSALRQRPLRKPLLLSARHKDLHRLPADRSPLPLRRRGIPSVSALFRQFLRPDPRSRRRPADSMDTCEFNAAAYVAEESRLATLCQGTQALGDQSRGRADVVPAGRVSDPRQ